MGYSAIKLNIEEARVSTITATNKFLLSLKLCIRYLLMIFFSSVKILHNSNIEIRLDTI